MTGREATPPTLCPARLNGVHVWERGLCVLCDETDFLLPPERCGHDWHDGHCHVCGSTERGRDMTPEQAADLAARTLAAIREEAAAPRRTNVDPVADRERVTSDLAGLQEAVQAYEVSRGGDQRWREFAVGVKHDREASLRRTANLYGVQP